MDKFNMDYIDSIMIVDNHGTITYSVRHNPRFDSDSNMEDERYIINKNFLEVYTNIDPSESTMFKSMKLRRPIYEDNQRFIDHRQRITHTRNLTIPIIRGGKVLGAIELSKDITKIHETMEDDYPGPSRLNLNQNIVYTFDDIVTNNKEMLNLIERAKIISDNDASVLIYGETGTGKELLAQSIHNYGNRANKPFIAQNCAALPENLFESILFGSTKGAFTGAEDRKGLFEEADGGTLFLDEINSMPLNLQAKLLRVLQDGMVRRIGKNTQRKVDVRIITAMNLDPSEALEENLIREDLFYRLNVFGFKMIPLRDRKEDLQVYLDYYLKRFNRKMEKNIKGASQEVKELFLRYDWPGNVRELEHIFESAVSFTQGEYIELHHIPIYLSDNLEADNKEEDMKIEGLDEPLDDILERIEVNLIKDALKKTGGNISKASDALKITRQRLHYKLKKYNLQVE